MAKTTPLPSSTHRLAARPAKKGIPRTVEEGRRILAPKELVVALPRDSHTALREMLDLMERVADAAWQKLKLDLTPEDLEVVVRATPDLDSLSPTQRWDSLLEDSIPPEIRKAAARSFIATLKERGLPASWAALRVEFTLLPEEAV